MLTETAEKPTKPPDKKEKKKPPAAVKKAAPDGLWTALLQAQRECESIPKDSRNDYTGYDYASAESVIRACRGPLHRAGLILFRDRWGLSSTDNGIMVVHVSFVLIYAATGQERVIDVPWMFSESKGRPWDKALAAALTTCEAYVLVGLLLAPRVLEEVDTRDDSTHEPAPRQIHAKKKTNTKPVKQGSSEFFAANDGPKFRFGDWDGKALIDPSVPTEDLEDYCRYLQKTLDKPEKAAFRDRNVAHIEECKRALEIRAKGIVDDDAAPAPADADGAPLIDPADVPF